MKILITGGAGFIGHHLCQHLLKTGHSIRVLDNLVTGDRGRLPSGVEFVEGNIRDSSITSTAMKDVDAVIHLAAEVSVPKTITEPELAQAVNHQGSINVLEAAKVAGVKKVVMASTAAVYGIAPQTPTSEDANLDPASPYATTKLAMEREAEKYATRGLPTCCLRLFNVYGQGQDPKSQYAAVIPAFFDRAKKNEPLSIYGDGEQTRDFVHISDVCRAFEAALTQGEGAINIASGRAVTINELAEMIVEATKSASVIQYLPEREGDPRESLANIDRARRELEYSSHTTLQEGLKTLTRSASGASSG